MIEADKLYEQAMALRAKATPGPWQIGQRDTRSSKRILRPDGRLLAYVGIYLGRDAMTQGLDNADCIVAAVNLLDALPALKAKWEREARLAEHSLGCIVCFQGEHSGIRCERAVELIAALQQPAAQAEEERRT